jgi:sugar phosphate isomerase/epimerase
MTVKLGICSWMIPVDEPEASIRFASEVGLKAVALELGSYEHDLPLSLKEEQGRYDAWRSQWDITYPALAVNTLCDHGMTDPSQRSVVEAIMNRAVEVALALDIPIVQLPSFFKGFITSQDGFLNTAERLKYACACAKGSGVIIASENALTAEEQLTLIEEVGSENFRIYFDTRNPFCMQGYHSAARLEKLFPYICEVHLKDGSGKGLENSQPLGKGDSGFFDSLEVLKRHNYPGWLLFENDYREMSQNSGLSTTVLIRQDIETVKGFFA